MSTDGSGPTAREFRDHGLHTLRYSAAGLMLTRGVPLEGVTKILGHFAIAVTGDSYGQVSPDVSREAMPTFGDALDR